MAAADQRTPGTRWTPFLFLLPFLFFFLLFWVIPLVGGVKMSLQANGVGQAEYVGFAHYKALASDGRYVTALRNSFTYTLASIVVIVPLALWLAHLLRATFRRLSSRADLRVAATGADATLGFGGAVFDGVLWRLRFFKSTRCYSSWI